VPTLSQYWFSSEFFGGAFRGWNEPIHTGRSSAIAGIPPFSGTDSASGATLVRERPDDELALPIAASVNANPVAVDALDGQLGAETKRTSPILASGLPWGQRLPYFESDPARHDPSAMLVRIYFDVHITTPVGCWDLDGTVSYYLMFFLDESSHLKAFVDAWGWHLGWKPADACRSSVRSQLSSGLGNAVPVVQGLLYSAIATFAPGRMTEIYLLPGSGTTQSGAFEEDADADVTLIVRPFRINPAAISTVTTGLGAQP
jgi:hypothetical protein